MQAKMTLKPLVAAALVATAALVAATPAAAQSDGGSHGSSALDDYFSDWYARVAEAQATQPDWITPLMTVTPRLEEEFRYDQYEDRLGNGANLQNFDGGKGLELIPTTTNEVLINLPPYQERQNVKPASGFGDWPLLTVKQRLLSSPSDAGDYVVSAFLGVQAPTGIRALSSHAWTVTPTLAAGKGWGPFDIQATLGAPIPLNHEETLGTSLVNNTTFQYRISEHFWPEFEVNSTWWSDGERGGKTQVFLTPGLVLGRFSFMGHTRAIFGFGYQFAVSPELTRKTVLTPTYQHAWIASARFAF